jgi:hypothetical protein
MTDHISISAQEAADRLASTTFHVMQALRLDLGYSQVHP